MIRSSISIDRSTRTSVYIGRPFVHSFASSSHITQVCILLCLPNTPFNFLYRKPQDPPSHVAPAPSLLTFQGIKKRVFDYALHYVVSTELTIANAMRRQFWWHKKILHAEDLHCPAVVGLASEDILLSAPAINKYLRDHCPPEKLEIVWWQVSARRPCMVHLYKCRPSLHIHH